MTLKRYREHLLDKEIFLEDIYNESAMNDILLKTKTNHSNAAYKQIGWTYAKQTWLVWILTNNITRSIKSFKWTAPSYGKSYRTGTGISLRLTKPNKKFTLLQLNFVPLEAN